MVVVVVVVVCCCWFVVACSWLVLSNFTLSYFDKRHAKEAKGSMDLSTVGTGFLSEEPDRDGKAPPTEHCLKLILPGRNFQMSFTSVTEKDIWRSWLLGLEDMLFGASASNCAASRADGNGLCLCNGCKVSSLVFDRVFFLVALHVGGACRACSWGVLRMPPFFVTAPTEFDVLEARFCM